MYENSTSPPVDLIDSTTTAVVFVFEFAVDPRGFVEDYTTNIFIFIYIYILYTYTMAVEIIYRRDSTC